MHFLPGKRTVMVFLAVAAVLILPLAASADFIFDLTKTNITNTPAVPSYATVDVHLTGLTTADFTVTTHEGFYLVDSNLFDFTANTTNPVTISSFRISTDGVTFTPFGFSDGSGHADGFGTFAVTINTTGKSGGELNSSDAVTAIKFSISTTGTSWGSADDVLLLVSASDTDLGQNYAAAHLWGFPTTSSAGSSQTGFVGGNFRVFPIPVPPSALLLGSGLLGLGLIGWRRREKKA